MSQHLPIQVVGNATYSIVDGSLYCYSVQDQIILQQLSSGVKCAKCLRDGEQLLVMMVKHINYGDPQQPKFFHIYSVVVLDSASFTPLLKFRENPDGEVTLPRMLRNSRLLALYSADFKTISFFTLPYTWERKGRSSEVLVLTLGKTILSLMTLRESCRATILQHVQIKDLVYLPLPEYLRNFLLGF